MTGTKIHGYLITAIRRKSHGVERSEKHEYETVFIYEDTSGKFVACDKIDDDVALQSWVTKNGADKSIENAHIELKLNHFRVREFWHTLS